MPPSLLPFCYLQTPAGQMLRGILIFSSLAFPEGEGPALSPAKRARPPSYSTLSSQLSSFWGQPGQPHMGRGCPCVSGAQWHPSCRMNPRILHQETLHCFPNVIVYLHRAGSVVRQGSRAKGLYSIFWRMGSFWLSPHATTHSTDIQGEMTGCVLMHKAGLTSVSRADRH